jgi:hypothetical protein
MRENFAQMIKLNQQPNTDTRFLRLSNKTPQNMGSERKYSITAIE